MAGASGRVPAQTATTVPAAARTMALFEIFARERRELSKSEVARLLDVPESSSSDLLNTLHGLGYVVRTPATRRYYPTARLLLIAEQIGENNTLTTFGTEATSLLAQQSGETACCAILGGGRIKILAVAEGRHRLRYVIGVGDTFSIHGTAMGKALIGGLEDEEMASLLRLGPLNQLTDKTKTDPREIEADVRAGRQRRWQAAVDEGTVGVSSLAVAGRLGDQVVGLGIIGPTERIVPSTALLTARLLEVQDAVFNDV